MEGGGSAASIEGANAPYEDWLRQYFYPPPHSNKKRTSHMRGSYTLPEFVSKNPSFPRFGAMLLDEERGRHGPVRSALPLKGCALTKIGSANASIPSSIPRQKKRTSHMRDSFTLPEFVSKNPSFPRFGAMLLDEERGRHGPVRSALPLKGCALTKIGSANASIPSSIPRQKKRTSHMRDSFTLPEFVSKNPSFPRFGAMLLDEERV